MSKLLRVAVNGAAGRMGREVITSCSREFADSMCIVAALESPSSPHIGDSIGSLVGIPELAVIISDRINSTAVTRPDVVIDFSTPDSAVKLLDSCIGMAVPVVTGTTGWEGQHEERIQNAAAVLPLLVASNMSVGVNLCLALLRQAAAVMADADVEIVEMHHNAKVDAPSGTALSMGQAICAARGSEHETVAVYGRGSGRRQPGSLGYASLRVSDSVGEHTVIFGLPGERVEISHKALNRSIFASGALRAARWLVDKPAGVYNMMQALGLSSGSAD